MKPAFTLLIAFVLSAAPAFPGAAEEAPEQPDSPQQRGGFRGETNKVYKAQITPHWFHNDTRFWYRNNLRGGAKEFLVVDAVKGTRERAFDHQKLAAALSRAAMKDFSSERLPFDNIEFIEEEKSIRFEASGKTWKCNLATYECSELRTEDGGNASAQAAPVVPSGIPGAGSVAPNPQQRQRGTGQR